MEGGKRIRLVRMHYGFSQQHAAERMFLSRDQVNRIERGEVAVHFSPGLLFCQFADLNPLWLAFGEPEKLWGFFYIRSDKLAQDLMARPEPTFLEIMQKYRGVFAIASIPFTSDGPELGSVPTNKDVVQLWTNPSGDEKLGSMKKLRKQSLWPSLRERIQRLVLQRGMKSALARDIGVSRQAINVLLSRKSPYGPSAEYALRLSKWVEIAEAQQKQRADRVSERRPERDSR